MIYKKVDAEAEPSPPSDRVVREQKLFRELVSQPNINGRYVRAFNNGRMFYGRIKLGIAAPPGKILVEEEITHVCWSSWASHIELLPH